MNEIKFEIDEKDIIIHTPSEWNELTLDQLLFIAPRVMLINESQRLKSEIIFHFLKMKPKKIEDMNLSQLKGLFPAVNWLFKAPELTKNLLPKLEILNIKFIGPDEEMKNIGTAQFAFADKFLGTFLKTKDEQFLNMLIASLYVEKGKKFGKDNIEQIAEYIKHLELEKRLAILAFFMGCRKMISDKNPDIFKKSNKVRRSKSGWLGFFYELAGPKIGTYTDVADMNFYEMLGIMRKINEDAREAEKRNRKGRR